MPQEFPKSLLEFQARFGNEDACAAYLFERRWPDGFRCPWCGHDKGWALRSKPHTHECASCGHQASVTAGTVLHRSKLPLTVWFWAAFLMATHSNGISALQLSKQLGVTYKTAWLLCSKLRRAMVDPDRSRLSGTVEVDEMILPFRTKDTPPNSGTGRDLTGKIAVVAAVEVEPFVRRNGRLGSAAKRVRLRSIEDFSATTLLSFVRDVVERRSTVRTDGLAAYDELDGVADLHGRVLVPADYVHDDTVVGKMSASVSLPHIHRVFAYAKRWGLGVYHGLRRKHIDTYLEEFAFRFNRRRSRHASFDTILGIAMRRGHASYADIKNGVMRGPPVFPRFVNDPVPF